MSAGLGLLVMSVSPALAKSGVPLITSLSLSGSQNAKNYLNSATQKTPLLTNAKQEALAKKALKRYFAPWHTPDSINEVKKAQKSSAALYLANPQYGYNYQKNSKAWIESLTNNMNLDTSWNNTREAIIVNNTNLRLLPTELPIFKSYKIAGEGFPFDTLALSALWVGEPVKVFTLTHDGAWALVQDHNFYGWVKTTAIAYVDQQFKSRFEAQQFVALTTDNKAVHARQGEFLFQSRIGMLFPKINNKILVPIRDLQGNAKTQAIQLSSDEYGDFPLLATSENFAKLMNQMMGEPYGWGGSYNSRDCSLTTQAMLLPFGILLPRSSATQENAGEKHSLAQLTSQQKKAYILKHGVPFLTIIHFPGHIALYIGEKQGEPLIFQNKWGIHTKDASGHEGRAIVGKANITTLELGGEVPHATATMLERADAITLVSQHR